VAERRNEPAGSGPVGRGERVEPGGEPATSRRSAWGALAASFARVTTSGNFISEIDGLRFIAIGTVVLFHLMVNLSIKAPAAYTPPAGGSLLVAIAAPGFHGVELFFIISGFILALPFATHYLKGGRPVGLKQYFLRRVTRLEPPYMLCMLIMFVALVKVKGRSPDALLPHLGASLLYLHNVVYGGESLVNNVAWSLEIEIQFYVLVPLLAAFFRVKDRRVRRTLLAGVAALSVVVGWLFITPETPRAYLSILRFLHFFLLGFLLADVYLVDWDARPRRDLAWDLVSLVGWPALFLVWNRGEAWSPLGLPPGRGSALAAVFFPAVALPLYMAAFRGRFTNALITTGWLTTIGGMCYTIYLFHNPLLGVILSATRHLVPTGSYSVNLLLQAVVATPLMLLPCGAYFLLVEKPCMRRDWPRRLLDRARTSLAAALD
jgi:peptidoglycan/LPS O-acetylase OafA/YrhL